MIIWTGKRQEIFVCLFQFLRTSYVLFLFSACTQVEDMPIGMQVDPGQLLVYVQTDQVQEFVIDGSAKTPITRFKVVSKLKNTREQLELDSILESPQKSVRFSWFFKAPVFSVDTAMYLYFELFCQSGESFKIARQLIVRGGNPMLVETTAWRIFPRNTGNPRNGFSINSLTYGTIGITDSSLMDFLDVSPDSLSMSWVSWSGGRFVRFNDFNYSAATVKSMGDAFDAGTKLEKVANLRVNDILLFRKTLANGDMTNAAIRITDISNSIVDPYYEFNMKK
jgi:hypothetical protein